MVKKGFIAAAILLGGLSVGIGCTDTNEENSTEYGEDAPETEFTSFQKEFWGYMANGSTSKLKEWSQEAAWRLTKTGDSEEQLELHKKLGMLNMMIIGDSGGVNNLDLGVIPNILFALIHSNFTGIPDTGIPDTDIPNTGIPETIDELNGELADQTGLPGNQDKKDPFALRLNLVLTKLLIPLLLNNEDGITEGVNQLLRAGEDEENWGKASKAQSIVYRETVGALLLSAYNKKFVERGVKLLQGAFDDFMECQDEACNDIRTLAPHYGLMGYLTLAEGYAMLKKTKLAQENMNLAIEAANRDKWPYKDQLNEYKDNFLAKFESSTQVKEIAFLPIKTGFKKEQPFLINPTNACHYCHAGQKQVPLRYLD